MHLQACRDMRQMAGFQTLCHLPLLQGSKNHQSILPITDNEQWSLCSLRQAGYQLRYGPIWFRT
jgi:hypothetical protein